MRQTLVAMAVGCLVGHGIGRGVVHVMERRTQVTELEMQYRIAVRMMAKFKEMKEAGKPLSQEQEAAVYSVVAEAHHP